MIADFGKMKTEFDNCLKKSANADGDDGSGEMTTDLATCIRNFARPEHLEGPNAWMCEQCAQVRNATRLTKLEKCPEFLLVHLKRFKVVYNKTEKKYTR